MNNVSQSFVLGRLLPFLNLHWFKIGVATLLLYAFLSKDFAFNISIQAPSEPATMPQSSRQERKETLTDAGLAQETATTTFDLLPSWGNDELPLLERIARLDESMIRNFIDRFSEVAKAEEDKFGIPSAITLANGLLHSQAGKAAYAQGGYNFFGLNCSDDWQGQTQDDHKGNCLRAYDNAWMSFRDHSLFYTTGVHSGFQQIPTSNHRAWAKAFNDSPHNMEDNLDQQLLSLIDRFSLK